MPKLRITEHDRLAPAAYTGGQAQVLMLPPVATQAVEIGNTSAQSVATNGRSQIVQLDAEEDCHIEVGRDPKASLASKRLVAGRLEHYGIAPGDKIAVIAADAPLPTADFEADVLTGDAPLEVKFTDKSTGSPTSWLWNFGDGTTSTEQNPTHTFDTPGTREITLIAVNDAGSAVEVKLGYIEVTDPEAE